MKEKEQKWTNQKKWRNDETQAPTMSFPQIDVTLHTIGTTKEPSRHTVQIESSSYINEQSFTAIRIQAIEEEVNDVCRACFSLFSCGKIDRGGRLYSF